MTEYIIFVLVIAALIVGGGLVAWTETSHRRQVWIWALIGAANLTAAVTNLWRGHGAGWLSLYHHKKDAQDKEDKS